MALTWPRFGSTLSHKLRGRGDTPQPVHRRRASGKLKFSPSPAQFAGEGAGE
jgi:hypothetical protein